jgi:RecB family endonuclease NucS
MKEILEVIQIISGLAIIISVMYAGYQVKLLRKTHTDNHDWNRRKSAQDLTMELNNTLKDTEILHQKLNVINREEPIPLQEILDAIQEDPAMQLMINKVLNIYSSIARGILNGVYDREIIEISRRTAMIDTYNAFSSYVMYRRDERGSDVWGRLESVVNRWKNEKTTQKSRDLTG